VVMRAEPLALPPLVRQIVRGTGQAERFTLDMAPDAPLVVGDADRVYEILSNLIHNALTYSPAGSPLAVRVAASDGDFVRVSVSDQGEGVPPADRERIFDRFYRVNRSDARPTYGSGLGLYIARGLVEAHGGRIWVESEPGSGSTFHFTLPAYIPARNEHDADTGR
jgi:NtrC-family two-component system sensor histidine kinase KinB